MIKADFLVVDKGMVSLVYPLGTKGALMHGRSP